MFRLGKHLSYGTVKRWLSIFAEEERKDNESAMKKKSSTTQNHMDSVLIWFEFGLNLVSLSFS